jgi:hypothetical protein
MFLNLLRSFVVIVLLGVLPAAAQDIVSRVKKGDYDDVRMDLNTAVLATGVSIQSQGNVAAMLGKTAADLGAMQTVYANAEFIAMCSARYSRCTWRSARSRFSSTRPRRSPARSWSVIGHWCCRRGQALRPRLPSLTSTHCSSGLWNRR